MHFDTEIRPFKTRSWFFLSKNQTSSSITKTVDTAMSVYMDWATIFKRWASIDTAADIEKETKQKAVWLTQIINNLKFQRYLRTVDATKPSELFVPHVHMVYKSMNTLSYYYFQFFNLGSIIKNLLIPQNISSFAEVFFFINNNCGIDFSWYFSRKDH